MNTPEIGGIVGAVVGIIGGLLGTFATVSNSESKRERRFAIRMSLWFWAYTVLFIGARFLYPSLPFLMLPYFISIPIFCILYNKKVLAMRREERK